MPTRKPFVEWGRVRERLADLICRRRGVEALRPTDLGWTEKQTGVDRTTIGRFLHMYPSSRTDNLHKRTVARLCAGLDVPENWLLHGVKSEQIGIWPRAIETQSDPGRSPAEVLLEAAAALVHVHDAGVQNLLARGAMLGMLEVAGAERVLLPSACYAALVWLEENRDVA